MTELWKNIVLRVGKPVLRDKISFFLVPKLFSDSDDSAGESGSGISGGLAQLVTALTEIVDVGMNNLKTEINFFLNILNLTL
jgi:hypothetical protein